MNMHKIPTPNLNLTFAFTFLVESKKQKTLIIWERTTIALGVGKNEHAQNSHS